MALSQRDFKSFCQSWLRESNIEGHGKLEEFIAACQGRLAMTFERRNQDNNFAVYSVTDAKKFFPSRNPVKWIVVRTSQGTTKEAAEIYRNIRGSFNPGDRVIACVIGDSRNLREYLRASLVPIVLLDFPKIRQFLFEHQPQQFLKQEIVNQVELDVLNPYEASGPAPEHMFVGRDEELKQITSARNRIIAVVGQRGIGKSSLLQAALRRMLREEGFLPFYVNCEVRRTYDALTEHIMALLHPRDKSRGQSYDLNTCLLRAKSAKRYVVLLLDEVDVLVRFCDETKDSKLFEHLNNAVRAEACQVVLAGYKDLRRVLYTRDHVLNRSLETLELKALEPEDARRLILEPTAELGITFANTEAIVKHIIDWTSCHPSYLQLYMKLLVRHASRPGGRVVNSDDLATVEASEEFYTGLLSTFLYDTTPLEKCVVCAALEHSEFDPSMIQNRLREFDYEPGFDAIFITCEDLVLANVFARKGKKYTFLFSGLPRIIREHQEYEQMFRGYIDDARRVQNA